MATKLTAVNPASIAATTTTQPKAKNVKTKNTPQKSNPKTETKAKRQVYANALAEPGLTDLDTFQQFCALTLPETYHTGYSHSVRSDGRIVASADIAIGVPQSLEQIRYNTINREVNWGAVNALLEAMRKPNTNPQGEPTPDSWVDDVSTIIITLQPSRSAIQIGDVEIPMTPAVADGQKRNIANILHRGTKRDIQKMLWYLAVNEHNRRCDDESKLLSHDIVVGIETLLPEEIIDGKLTRPTSMNIEDWLDMLDKHDESGSKTVHPDAMDLPLKGFEYDENRTQAEPYYFGVRIGVSNLVFGRCDQNIQERDGGDFIAQTRDTGNILVAHQLPQNIAATLTRNIGLRCKGWTPTEETRTIENPDGSKSIELTGKKIEKRGSLSDGKKFISPPAYPNFFRFYQVRILSAWGAYNAAEGIFNEVDPETGEVSRVVDSPATDGKTGNAAYKYATKSPSDGGGAIPNVAIQVALGLRDPRQGKFTDYQSELLDIAYRLRYGVYIDHAADKYVTDTAFKPLRKRLEDAAKVKATVKTEEIVCDIVEAWKKLYPENAKSASGKPAPVGRFPGYDTDGISIEESDSLGIMHPGKPKPGKRGKNKPKKDKA
jgi:hypothetical protein